MTCSIPVVDEKCINISQEPEPENLPESNNDDIKMGH
jgi:hypothetical protein